MENKKFKCFFKKANQKITKKAVIGFDIETHGTENNFLCASLSFPDDSFMTFYDKKDVVKEIMKKKYKNHFIAATNLGFDYFGTFFGTENIKHFRFIQRSSELLSAYTYIYKGQMYAKRPCKSAWKLEFIDTMNYSRISVSQIGEILKLGKLKKPDFLGTVPRSMLEWNSLIEYNKRDAEISRKFIEFLKSAFEKLGATFKITIASTAMSLFRNKYFTGCFVPHERSILDKIFNAYYGGRCENFVRGGFKSLTDNDKWHMYDYNSLYPKIMKDFEVPHPNYLKMVRLNTNKYIMNFEGMSFCHVEAPYMKYPILPLRKDGKLLFPVGEFEGWWCHNELRYALQHGYVIKHVYETVYYTKTVPLFNEFVTDLYTQRKMYLKQGSPMEYVIKILMNSLYGKFGQKYGIRSEMQPFNMTYDDILKQENPEVIGDFVFTKKDTEPRFFCFPEICAYITSNARIKLHKTMLVENPIYVDTDSIMIDHTIQDSSEIGELKHEFIIDELFIIKPKFYGYKGYSIKHGKMKENVKIKGVPMMLTIPKVFELLSGMDDDGKPHFKYTKFLKLRESLRRHMTPNHKVEVDKKLDLYDNKREWDEKQFDFNRLYTSKPRNVSSPLNDDNIFSLVSLEHS